MNVIRPGLRPDTLECSWPPARPGFVLVEDLRCYVPDDLFAPTRKRDVMKVVAEYPGASFKLIEYVLHEGVAQTIEKTRAKIVQKSVILDLAMSAVGRVAAAPDTAPLEVGDLVACGGFLLPVAANAYLLHPDQCIRLDRDALGIERHLWLGAAIRLAASLRESGARSLGLAGLGSLDAPLRETLASLGLRAEPLGNADAAIAGGAWWAQRGSSDTTPVPPKGLVLGGNAAAAALPAGWTWIGMPRAGQRRIDPLDPRPLEWPFPFEPEGRKLAITILEGGARVPRGAPSGTHPRRIDTAGRRAGFGLSIVGCGNFARAVLLFHALRVPGTRLRGVCDIRPEVAAAQGMSLRAAFHTADFAELLRDEATEAVLVTTDHGSHAAHAVAALEAGKSVHLEKPPAVTPEQLTELVSTLDRTSGVLTIGYNRPHAPAFRILMDVLRAERGPVTVAMSVKGFKLPPEHWYYWPNQGTRIAGNVVHWLDLGYRLVGSLIPTSVSVVRDGSRPPAAICDAMSIAIVFSDGSLVSIVFTSAGDDLRGVREWIEAGRGSSTVRVDNFDRLSVLRGPRSYRRSFSRDRGHAAEIRTAIRRLMERRPDGGAIRDMIVTSAILFAAQRSFESGREEAVDILPSWRAALLDESARVGIATDSAIP